MADELADLMPDVLDALVDTDPLALRDHAIALVAEVRRLRAAIEAALVPAAHIDKDDEAGDAVVRTLLAALEADL